MSLLIIGSCSRITSNIILSLAKRKLYERITIADLLPLYSHHHRYYQLRKQLNDQQTKLPVAIDKIIDINSLNQLVKNHQDVLHVTHDYFTSVTSKRKIMEITAQLTKDKKNVLFAAPIEYDHYGELNPEQSFLDDKAKVKEVNPNAGFIRSDVQDNTEIYAYLHKSKKIWEEKLLQTPDSFKPKVVNSNFFTQKVIDLLEQGPKGADLIIRGQKQRHFTQVKHNSQIDDNELSHQVENIRLLVTKYRGPEDRYGTLLTSKFL